MVFVCDLFILRPVRYQTPTERIHRSLAGLWMTPDCENVLGRRDVVTEWKVELRRDRNVIAKAKPAVVEIFIRDATGTPKTLGEHPPHRHAHLPSIEWPILGALMSQKLLDQRFFFFQLVDAGVNFPATEVIQGHVLNNLPRVTLTANGE